MSGRIVPALEWGDIFSFEDYGLLLQLVSNSLIAGAVLGIVGGLIGIFIMRYDLVIIAGHSEYWTYGMRQQVKAFINGGGRFMNLSGNTMWWQVRFEDNGRTMVGYKSWRKDPEKSAELSTDVNWDRPIFDSSFTITGLHWPYGGYPGGTGDGLCS